MGSRWEVWAWRRVRGSGGRFGPDYVWTEVYGGRAWFMAVWAAIKAKRTAPYVRVEWR